MLYIKDARRKEIEEKKKRRGGVSHVLRWTGSEPWPRGSWRIRGQPESSFVFQIKRVHQVDLILQANRRLSDSKKKLHVLTNRFSKSRRWFLLCRQYIKKSVPVAKAITSKSFWKKYWVRRLNRIMKYVKVSPMK